MDPEQGIMDPNDEMVKRLEQLISESKFEESVRRTGELSSVINTLKWNEATVETRDLADRFDIISQRLDAMHREMLSPRIEQLRKLHQRAVGIKDKLRSLESEDQISRWHERTEGLLEDIESADVAQDQVKPIRDAMADSGWRAGGQQGWSWELTSTNALYLAPAEYDSHLENLIGEIQNHINELAIAGTPIANDGNVPPKYKHLVDRYLDVLAGAVNDNEGD